MVNTTLNISIPNHIPTMPSSNLEEMEIDFITYNFYDDFFGDAIYRGKW